MIQAPVLTKLNNIRKEPFGRPLKYTKEQCLQKVKKYFSDTSDERLTITGLCVALDISRETLSEWTKNEDKEFAEIIRSAKRRIVESYEILLKAKGHPGSIFGLKNIDRDHWKDKSEVDHTSGGKPILPATINLLAVAREDLPMLNQETQTQ